MILCIKAIHDGCVNFDLAFHVRVQCTSKCLINFEIPRAPDPGQSYTKAKFKLRFRHPSVFSPEHFKGLVRTRTPEFVQTDLQALTKLYTYLVGHDLVILDKTGFDVVWSTAVTIMPSTLFLPSSLHSSLDVITSNVFVSTPGLTLFPSHIHGTSTVYVLYGMTIELF